MKVAYLSPVPVAAPPPCLASTIADLHNRAQEAECELAGVRVELEAARAELEIVKRAYDAERERANRLEAQLDEALVVAVS